MKYTARWGRWYPSEKFSSIARQDYTLYKYMNKSIQEFHVNFHDVKMSNHTSLIRLNAIFRETTFYFAQIQILGMFAQKYRFVTK